MGLLFAEEASVDVKARQEIALLHRLGCKVCPLRSQPGRMPATGSRKPLILMLGEAPGSSEIEEGEQFVGKSGQLLRPRIPRELKDRVRWDNVVASRPQNNRTPTWTEIECCRPQRIANVEESQPKAIFGFGNIPLNWVSGFNGVIVWRGRRMPVQVGKHACWYYVFLHPSALLRQRRHDEPSEDEYIWRLDLKRAFAEVLAGLPVPEPHTEAMARQGVEIVTQYDERGLARIEAFLGGAARELVNGLDYETNCLRPYEGGSKVLTAAVSTGKSTLAFPFDHPQAAWNERHRRHLDEIWMRYLEKAKAIKAVHSLAFEMEWTAVKFGEHLLRTQPWACTATQASILDERRGKSKPGPLSLEFLVQQYFGFNLKNLSNVDRKNLSSAPLDKVLLYNGLDAKYHKLLWEKQDARISQEGLREPYELGLRKVPTLVLAQVRGVPVDQVEVKRLQGKYKLQLERIEAEIAALEIVKQFNRSKGAVFNPYSQPDCLYVFWTMLKRVECRVKDKWSKEDKLSVDEGVLEKIDHPLARLVVELRKINKRKSTYVDPLDSENEDNALFTDSMLHVQFHTYFAETGRLSCSDVNLQNYPNRDEEARELRKQVKADKGKLILSFDMGQIEARVTAMFTLDPVFIKALWERYDIHADEAGHLAHAYPARIGGKKFLSDKKVMKAFRKDIKNQWTFPLIFGAKAESVASYLNIPINVIRPQFDRFWDKFGEIYKWQEKTLKFYREHGYVECLNGRRRHGPMSANQIFNSPIQGSAAEIVLDAMCRLSETGDPELQPEMQIHDDLTWVRIDASRVDIVAEKIIDHMLDVPFKWAHVVPLTVEMSVGPNWLEMDSMGTYSSDTWKRTK